VSSKSLQYSTPRRLVNLNAIHRLYAQCSQSNTFRNSEHKLSKIFSAILQSICFRMKRTAGVLIARYISQMEGGEGVWPSISWLITRNFGNALAGSSSVILTNVIVNGNQKHQNLEPRVKFADHKTHLLQSSDRSKLRNSG